MNISCFPCFYSNSNLSFGFVKTLRHLQNSGNIHSKLTGVNMTPSWLLLGWSRYDSNDWSRSRLQTDSNAWSRFWLQRLELGVTPKWLQAGVNPDFCRKISAHFLGVRLTPIGVTFEWLQVRGVKLIPKLTPTLGVVSDPNAWSQE